MVHPASWVKAVIISAATAIIILILGLYLYWLNYYQDRAYPGTRVGNVDISGSTQEQAAELISARTENIINTGIVFKFADKSLTLPTSNLSFSAESSFPVLVFENQKTLAAVFSEQGKRGFFSYLASFINKYSPKRISPAYTLDEEQVTAWLEDNFSELSTPPINAHFSLEKDGITLKKIPESAGQLLNYERAINDLRVYLESLENPTISILLTAKAPDVVIQDLTGWENKILKILENKGFSLKLPEDNISKTLKKKQWLVSPAELITWIKVDKQNEQSRLTLDEIKVSAYLSEKIAPNIDHEAVLPRLEMSGGKVVSWQSGQPGYLLNATSSAQNIASQFSNGEFESQLVATEITTEHISSANDFQIRDLLGTGHSRFTGSSANRRHNIKTGADALHGLLIKPGEEFSLLNALGNIDASSGYLPELVIKGNKTIPEYGGGLCQIGTTVFRGALDTGLPITQRRNHSYRVSYYEPAGTDATIYDPAPDFRFLNDTGNYILIQARISGDDLYFDFWGTHDGRTASVTEPVIYNIVKPAPTKIVETDTLPPGVKKCTESAHSGADAYFDYTVVYPEGSTTTPIKTKRFSSHYVPWQAVCLVGKEKDSHSNPGPRDSTSTPVVATSTAGTASSSPEN